MDTATAKLGGQVGSAAKKLTATHPRVATPALGQLESTPSVAMPPTAVALMRLQRLIGNQRVSQLLSTPARGSTETLHRMSYVKTPKESDEIKTLAALNGVLGALGIGLIDPNSQPVREQLGLLAVAQPAVNVGQGGSVAPPPPPPPQKGAPKLIGKQPVIPKSASPVNEQDVATLDAAIASSKHTILATNPSPSLAYAEIIRAIRLSREGRVDAPRQLPAPAEPKAGVELEASSVTFKPLRDAPLSHDERELVKGATIVPVGDQRPLAGDFWRATVELAGPGVFRLEVIIDGPEGKGVPIPRTAQGFAAVFTQIGKEIQAAVTTSIEVGMTFNIAIPGKNLQNRERAEALEQLQWRVTKKDVAPTFGLQVTVPMPLETLTKYGKEGSGFKKLLGQTGWQVVSVEPEQLPKWAQGKGVDTLRGFLNLIFTYARNSLTIGTGLKHKSPIMPRTNFVAMKDMVLSTEFGAALAAEALHQGLSPNALFKSLIETTYNNSTGGPLSIKSFYWEEKELRCDDWINALLVDNEDLIQRIEKEFRHGQIGGLKDTTEAVRGQRAPIVEFRDAGSLTLGEVARGLGEIALEIFELHARP